MLHASCIGQTGPHFWGSTSVQQAQATPVDAACSCGWTLSLMCQCGHAGEAAMSRLSHGSHIKGMFQGLQNVRKPVYICAVWYMGCDSPGPCALLRSASGYQPWRAAPPPPPRGHPWPPPGCPLQRPRQAGERQHSRLLSSSRSGLQHTVFSWLLQQLCKALQVACQQVAIGTPRAALRQLCCQAMPSQVCAAPVDALRNPGLPGLVRSPRRAPPRLRLTTVPGGTGMRTGVVCRHSCLCTPLQQLLQV